MKTVLKRSFVYDWVTALFNWDWGVDRVDPSMVQLCVDPAKQFEQGLLHHQSGRIEAAADAYRQVIAAMPDYADAHHLLGVIAMSKGAYAEAVPLIAAAVRLCPSSPHYTRALGSALMGLGDVASAASAFATALRLRPDFPEAYYGLGAARSRQGHYRAAAYNFYRALLCRPRYAEARRDLQTVLSKLRLRGGDRLVTAVTRHLQQNIRVPTPQTERSDTMIKDQTAAPPERTGDCGFTLLEMLVVLVVLSLMVGLVVARGPSRSPSLEAQAAAGRLAQLLREARGTAMVAGMPVRVDVDLLHRAARAGTGPVLTLPPPIRLSYTNLAGHTALTGRAAVAFDPDGSSSGGAFGVALQTVGRLVAIDAFTGHVGIADSPRVNVGIANGG